MKIIFICTIDGGWGVWSAWSECPVTCGGGQQIRSRLCNSPAPNNGGATCPGQNQDSQACSIQTCGGPPPVGKAILFFGKKYIHILF